MGEIVGAASGGLTFANATYKTTVALYEELQGFRRYPEEVKELKGELQHMNATLEFLQTLTLEDSDVLRGLEPGLRRCESRSNQLLKAITRCTANTQGGRPNVKDWWKWRLSREDIVSLTITLAREKDTLTMTIGGLNLSKHAATARAIDEYQRHISTMIEATKAQLSEVNDKIEAVAAQGSDLASENDDARKELQDQKQICEDNLTIFEGVLDMLRGLRSDTLHTVLEDQQLSGLACEVLEKPTTEQMTVSDIHVFEAKIPRVILNISKRLRIIDDQLRSLGDRNREDLVSLDRDREVEENRLSALERFSKQASDKRANVFQDIRAAKNSRQTIISTYGDLIHASNVSTEPGAEQLLGQTTEAAVCLHFQGGNHASRQADMTKESGLSHWILLLVVVIIGCSQVAAFTKDATMAHR